MKKKQYTREQMLTIYSDWQQSGLSKKAYCHKIGLTTSTFFYWIKKLAPHIQDAVEDSTGEGFARLDFSTHAQAFLEIEYPSGTRLRFYSQPAANWIKTLL